MARREKTLANLPAQIYNLGSPAGENLDFSRAKLWERMDAPMGAKAVSVPVFLVNEAQMDYIYPPERRRALSPERVRDWLRREKERREIKDPFEWLREWELGDWYRYRVIVAVGVYISDLKCDKQKLIDYGDSNFCIVEAKDVLMNLTGPVIFLCPERIINWAQKANVPVEIVLDKVYYHELGHAIMDTGDTPYETVWGRTIEESCANWIAYNRFKPSEAIFVQRIINDQPAEYQGYAWLEEIHFLPLEWMDQEVIQFLRLLEEIHFLTLNWIDRKFTRFFRLLKLLDISKSKSIVSIWMQQKLKGFSAGDEVIWSKIAKSLLELIFAR